jgi:protein Tex
MSESLVRKTAAELRQSALARLIIERPVDKTPALLRNLVGLLDEGASVPFIARYRKELTGAMDEVEIGTIKDRYETLCDLEDRKQTVLDAIQQQGKLTPELAATISDCYDRSVLEDIYLPYKPKRKTKAAIARERGLEPLATAILVAGGAYADLASAATAFVDPARGVASVAEALEGAGHIIAEVVSETAIIRAQLREHLLREGQIVATRAEDIDPQQRTKFEMYYDFREPVSSIPAHRYLAIRRGEAESVLRSQIVGDDNTLLYILTAHFLTVPQGASAAFIHDCLVDALERLLLPTLTTEVRLELKRRAEAEAITVFAQNLRQVLLAPPSNDRRVIGLDPGYRTGCKIAVIDETGKLLAYDTIYPHPPQGHYLEAVSRLKQLAQQHQAGIIAVGNGTASRETMALAQEVAAQIPQGLAVLVNESGASIYSASEVARQEFPDLDLTLRSAVSIARRFQDPLAELVKIDAKSIGVGQYQHDVDQPALRKSLETVVESAVNYVGVDLNTASETLLRYVSGIGPTVAKEIVRYRNTHGKFNNRQQLLDVPRIGPKTFEQAAGFLRIRGGEHPLDNTAVHPESYPAVTQIAQQLAQPLTFLLGNQTLLDGLRAVDWQQILGAFTFQDIVTELKKPGRDPRTEFVVVNFAAEVQSIGDLRIGMLLEGVVTNVTNFGAFVDIGVHQDGLVHVSQLSDRFIRVPTEIVQVGQRVKVRVLEVDAARNRISLSMKEARSSAVASSAAPTSVANAALTREQAPAPASAKSTNQTPKTSPKPTPVKASSPPKASRTANNANAVNDASMSLAEKLAAVWNQKRSR